jgi:RNA polymerase sigma factor (sigma-70 family)
MYSFETLEDQVINQQAVERIFQIVSTLPHMTETNKARAAEIIFSRYYEKLTYAELAKVHGVSVQRIRQIEAKAYRGIRKLFKPL